ncbi:hypothetical protein FRB99_005045 [Tulasnella sp. 403]|nr:hypothetical protein FRB99_005045 [Tulasnella sp. 403]
MSNTTLSWTSADPLQSQLFSSWGTLYRFDTTTANGKTITTLYRAIKQGKEDRIARLEWGSNGSLGRATIGRNMVSMLDLVRPSGEPFSRMFTGPDGYQYRWKPDPFSAEYILEDFNGNVIAFYRPIFPSKKYNIGEVHGELCFVANAGSGMVLHPPLMDMGAAFVILKTHFTPLLRHRPFPMTVDNTADNERQPLLRSDNVSYQAAGSSGSVTPDLVNKPQANPDLTWILLALWSAVFLGALDTTIVATLLTSVGSHFNRAHLSSYLGSSYSLSICCFTPLYGRLSDIMGRKGAMLLAQCLFTIGTIFCGLAPSMNTLIAARAIAGMGGGGVMTVLSIILVAMLVDVKLPSQPQTLKEKLRRIDYLGSITLVLAVGGFLLGVMLMATEEMHLHDPLISGLFVTSALSIAGFFYVEGWVVSEPILPLKLLRQRTPMAVAVNNFLASIAAFSMLYNYPVYFTAVRLTSAETAGLHLLPNAVAIAAGSVMAGLYMRITGKFYYWTLFSGILGISSSAMIASWGPSSRSYHFWLDIIPGGFGQSSIITSTLIALIACVGREDMAVATGVSYLFRTTGQVLGISISGAILQSLLLKNLRERITVPGAAEIIKRIRYSTTIIPELEPDIRDAAVESYALALKAVFRFQVFIAVLAFISTLPIEENPLPGSHAEQIEHDERRRVRTESQSD